MPSLGTPRPPSPNNDDARTCGEQCFSSEINQKRQRLRKLCKARRPSPLRRLRPRNCAGRSIRRRLASRSTAELEPISGLIGQERALKAIQFGSQFQSARFQSVRARAAGLRQAHGGQAVPRQEGARGQRSQRLGLRQQLRNPEPPARAETAFRPGAPVGQGHGRGDRRAAHHAPGHVRGRRLPGPPPRPSTRSSAPARRRRSRR